MQEPRTCRAPVEPRYCVARRLFPCDVGVMEPATPPWPKACGCGEIWSRAEWPELTPIGRYDAGSDGWIELRSCVCGASLVVTAVDLDERTDATSRA